MKLKISLIFTVLVCLLLGHSVWSSAKPWMSTQLSPKERAQQLLSAMTLDEKLLMVHGSSGSDYVGYVPGNDRLGIPALKLNDGPQGFRDDSHPGTSTCWPSTLTMGATWDRDLVYKWGVALGKDFYLKGSNVLLGPGLNLARVPVNGRNFEYLSGGDPFLGYSLVQPLVKGIQSQPIIANAKHWIQNNQEENRGDVSANVDERTRHELYYQPFLGAIEAGVGSFMCSYNKINNVWSCENDETLNTDLKTHLNFTGWVMSDWGATHSVSIDKGLDQEMPGGDYLGSKLADMINNGEMDVSVVDNAVLRILTPMFTVGLFDDINNNDLSNDVTSKENNDFARKLSASSHVLLKNGANLLPLSKSKKMKIALFGKSGLEPVVAGGGSGAVFPPYVISPYHGLMNALKIPIPDMTYSCNATLTQNAQYYQWGCQSAPGTSVDDCCNQCGKMSGCHHFTYLNGRCGFYPTGAEMRPSPDGKVAGECKKTNPPSTWQCNENGACVAFHDGSDIDSAMDLAKEADVNIIAVSQFSREGSDRDNLSFDVKPGQQCQVVPQGQNNLVSSIASVGVPSIVAATAPGAVTLPWDDQVNAILLGFLPGQEYGNALADILFGDHNPSARLPLTLPNIENEVGFTKLQYPGIKKETIYSERMMIDYRWYTSNNVKPAYAFGHGLSYTEFGYSDVIVKKGRKVGVTVTNKGTVPGEEVVQMYVTFPDLAQTPPLQLKGFVKTSLLKPGESQYVEMELSDRSLSIWSVSKKSWEVVPGEYLVSVGAASDDLRATAVVNVL